MSATQSPAKKKKGFTMIELLITAALLALLIILALFLWQNQLAKARDARRKADLERLKIAFEDYYNDNECYPPSNILETCQGEQLQPYLNSVPCDPLTDEPYCYIHDQDNLACGQSYRILASFENVFDKIIERLKCHGEEYCGWEDECGSSSDENVNYNYGVSSADSTVLNPLVTPPPEPDGTPEPSPSPYLDGQFACDSGGICNFYDDPESSGCPITFDDSFCNYSCGDPANWCLE